jgi:hypothetical protein
MLEKKKILKIFYHLIPIILMILLIPLVKDDILLTLIYILIISISLLLNIERKDTFFFIFGFITMIIAEYIFIGTGVEVFKRNSLFGIMPLWLPFLWGYVFISIRKGINILGTR